MDGMLIYLPHIAYNTGEIELAIVARAAFSNGASINNIRLALQSDISVWTNKTGWMGNCLYAVMQIWLCA